MWLYYYSEAIGRVHFVDKMLLVIVMPIYWIFLCSFTLANVRFHIFSIFHNINMQKCVNKVNLGKKTYSWWSKCILLSWNWTRCSRWFFFLIFDRFFLYRESNEQKRESTKYVILVITVWSRTVTDIRIFIVFPNIPTFVFKYSDRGIFRLIEFVCNF